MSATVEDVARQASPPPVCSYLSASDRANRFETALEKCVEAGADIIRLIVGEYSQRGDEASASRMDRWQRIVIEAAEQSGRLLVIEPPERLPRLLDSYRAPSLPLTRPEVRPSTSRRCSRRPGVSRWPSARRAASVPRKRRD